MAQSPVPISSVVYASLTGAIDQGMVTRVFQSMAVAMIGGVKTLHLLFQSTGGGVADGIAMHNYFKSIPVDLRIYNGGTVSSIATIAFLGAKRRYASANATFMVHKTHTPNQMPPANAARLRSLANAFEIEDARTRAILTASLTISEKRLSDHLDTESPFDAKEALACGLITEIRDFVVPIGSVVSNI